jgi:eukaryotic-like serine/threonine-protein kinase
MNLHFDDASLLKYLKEELSAEEQAAIDEHLEVCAGRRCAETLERLAHSPDVSLPLFLKTTQEVANPEDERLPELPQRYELLGLVGRGGMGLVLRVRDRALNRELALKTVRQPLPEDDPRLRRFHEEALLTAQLQHPGVPPVHELGQLPDGRPFFAMKLVRGETLAARLQARSSPADGLSELLRAFEQVCEALAYAHSHDVIHRDIKPANVMIGAHGEVQLMDWGLAKKLRRRAPSPAAGVTAGETERTVIDPPGRDDGYETKGALGTYAYMAPEAARGRVRLQDERADVFSLGAVLCEVLTGQPPYTGPSYTQLREQAEDVTLGPAYARLDGCGAPGELVALAKRCLAAERDARPRDAAAVWQAVRAYREGEQERRRQAELRAAEERARAEKAEEVARAERARAVAERRARRRAVAVVTAGLLLLAAVVGGWWWLTERQAADEQAVAQALAERDALRGRAFAAPVGEMERLFREARGAAERAVKLAEGGFVSAALRRRAEEALVAAGGDVQQAARDRALLARSMDTTHLRETGRHQPDERGHLGALAELSEDEQFAQAFRDWGLEVDAVPLGESAARLKRRPKSVVQEVVAALDEWALQRRWDGRRPEADWRRLHELADQLDESAPRRQQRRLLAEAPLRPSSATLAGWATARARVRDHARRLDPATAPVLEVISLARTQATFGDAAGAESLLRRALAAHPDEVGLLVTLGALLSVLEPKRPGEAIECYRAARALRPDLGLALSRALIGSKRAAEAEAICRNLVQRFADHPEPYLYLGVALSRQKKLREAEGAYRKAVELRPSDPLAHTNLGHTLREQQKPAEAEAAHRQALALRPDFPEAQNNLGLALLDLKRPVEAEAHFRKAIKLRPNFAEAYTNLGIALRDLKKPGQAEAAFRKAVELRPDFPEAHYNLGTALDKQKKPAEVEAAFRKAIKLRPDYTDAYINLGIALHGQKRVDEAASAFRKATELRPDLPEAHVGLGNALRDQQKLDEAVAAYRKAIELGPDYRDAYLNLGNALLAQKKPAQAEAAYRKALALRPNFPLAYTNLGVALRDQRKMDEAVAAHRKAIELRPKYPDAYLNLGGALRDQNKPAEAEAAFRRAIELRPDFPEAYNSLGIALLDQQKLDEAVAAFRKAIALRPKHPEAYTNLGNVLRSLKQLREAEAVYRQAIALQPDLPEAYSNLGTVLNERNRPAEAETALRKAIALRPDFPGAYTNLGNALRSLKKLREAEAAYRQAIALQPNLPEAHANLGVILHEQKRPAEAETAFRKAIELRPKNAKDYNCLGVALYEQKRPAEAETAFRKAIELRPDYPEAHFNLGNALYARQKLAEAVAAYRKAIELWPDVPQAHIGLGIALRDQKKLDAAVNALREAVRLAPNHPGIRAALRRTERWLALDSQLPGILGGKVKLATPAERLEVAELCRDYRHYHLTAAGLYAEAFRADPKLLEDLNQQNRFHAASAAALALAGKGADAPALFPEECFWLSAQARSWLRGDLARYTRDVQKKKEPPVARAVVERLKGWKQAEALAGVREPKSLAGFPEQERREWLRLWADVDALLQRLEPLAGAGE